jgi:hypothetical protein
MLASERLEDFSLSQKRDAQPGAAPNQTLCCVDNVRSLFNGS